MERFLKLAVLVVGVVVGQSALAVDYYWVFTFGISEHYASPDAACQSLDGDPWSSGGHIEYVRANPTDSPDRFLCIVNYVHENGSVSNPNSVYTSVDRQGTSCPDGATYNAQTGACDAPPPTNFGEQCSTSSSGMPSIVDSQGVCTPFYQADTPASCKWMGSQGTKAISVFVTFDDQGAPLKPEIEKFGCEVSVIDVSHCKMPVSKSSSGVTLVPNGVKCQVAANFTGNVASPNSPSTVPEGNSDQPGVCPDGVDCTPDAPVVTDSQPCTYVLDGEGRKVCTAWNFTGNPGSSDCGEVNGNFTCIDKPPISTGKQTDTIVQTTPNADGTSTTTKTDTHKQVVCSGVDSCTTTTTTSTTKTVIDSAGNFLSTSGECSGEACSTDGKSDQNGDGLKDCSTDDTCSQGAVEGEDCDVPLVCQGDAVSCAVLKQEKELRCKVDKLYDLEGNKAAIDQMLQGEQFQLDEQVTQAPSFISEATSFLPKSCPPPETTSLATGGLNVSFEYQPLCDFAEALGPLVVIVASVFSALYVGRAFGGE